MKTSFRTPLILLALSSAVACGTLGGCIHSDIVPMKPLQRTEVWVPNAPAATTMPTTSTAPATMAASSEPATSEPAATQYASTAPATLPATTESASTQTAATAPAATEPGQKVVHVIDPNQTARFIYKANYDNIWQQALHILARTGFRMDRLDYRLGVMSTMPLPSSQIAEFFRPQQTTVKNSLENTLHTQQRSVRITITAVPNKPDFYEIAVQVRVERQSNPQEIIGGPIFVEGSGFGRSNVALRSDYIVLNGKESEPARWITIGRDPHLEQKLLKELFNRI